MELAPSIMLHNRGSCKHLQMLELRKQAGRRSLQRRRRRLQGFAQRVDVRIPECRGQTLRVLAVAAAGPPGDLLQHRYGHGRPRVGFPCAARNVNTISVVILLGSLIPTNGAKVWFHINPA